MFSNTVPCKEETDTAVTKYDDLQNWLDTMPHETLYRKIPLSFFESEIDKYLLFLFLISRTADTI